MTLIINPGTGPARGATEEDATKNIGKFIEDLNLAGVTFERAPADDYNIEFQDGRFAFTLRLEDRTCEVQMPGLSIERVRFTGADGQNIWHFPRLYVEGSSWVWSFALGSAADYLTGKADEDAS